MKKILIFFIIITFYGCSKPKTVLICGDHVCINKAEAEQYFEENLTLEVKIIDRKELKEDDLVELNLRSSPSENKKISVFKKKQTNKKIKILTNDEIKKKKIELINKKKLKKKKIKDKKLIKQAKLKKIDKNLQSKNKVIKSKQIVNKTDKKISDICAIIKKCSIDEISKYLVKQSKNRKFPDITIREN